MTLITNHQFKNKHFYFPHHKINFLFIGTFNPEFGEKVPYYYGRKTNYFWRIMSIIFQNKINPYDENFFNLLTKYKIGCIDIVDSVSYENKDLTVYSFQLKSKLNIDMFSNKMKTYGCALFQLE